MLQSNCKPLTAAAVFGPSNEMEDESDWHCAKGYCQCNTTSVIPPVSKAMSVKRRCLERLSQNMPQWQISRKELHTLEGKLVDLNLFVWFQHCQPHWLNGQTVSATQCFLGTYLKMCTSAGSKNNGFEGLRWLKNVSSSVFFQEFHWLQHHKKEMLLDWENETNEWH